VPESSLKRDKKDEALFYWEQGHTFYSASRGLPLGSAPLLLYYSFMNAAKALLSAKGIAFDARHGVTEWKTAVASRDSLKTVGIQIKNNGVLPALSSYYGEPELRKKHSLQELFFNIPFIHRTYCLTYASQNEMFLPLTDCAYVFERPTNQAYLVASLSRDHASKRSMRRLPTSLIPDPTRGPAAMRSHGSVPFVRPNKPTPTDLKNLSALHKQLRKDLFYINGTQTLWYAKAVTAGPQRLERQCPTLVLAAMHRLSELCRYQPMSLALHLSGHANWLLSEFIEMSSAQFIDEVSSEITGHQVLMPNVRPAT
jgi:hypothetical protein